MNLFELPRLDWYDDDGRLYKDAIIENLNALEDKLNELAAINAFNAETPDVSNLHLDDVTLESEEDKIVNLRSLINIFNLVNYPMELEFSGTKIKKISYWNSSYNYITRTDISTNVTDTNKFIFFNFSDNSVRVANEVVIGESEALIGCYLEGRVINMFTPYFAKLNLMYLLGNMKQSSLEFTIAHNGGEKYFSDGQMAARNASAESKASPVTAKMIQYGREK